ncbi:MAG: LysM peptidoglycan-binding domain-containing protein [Bacteroidales bacterium]|nr:LysM peptidoglycan-binding domain-containing protein [Bacteroidales bacterium]
MLRKHHRNWLGGLVAACMAFLVAIPAEGQVFRGKKNDREERARMQEKIDSLYREIARLQMNLASRDSIVAEIAEILEENDDRSYPDSLLEKEYSPEVTDSLMNVWYQQNKQLDNDELDAYNMDSIHFTSSVSDSVLLGRLERMNSFITLPFNQTVRNYIVLYSEKMPAKMKRMLGLCEYYMPIFEETFNKYNLPDELKYMAIIESALNPTAVSRAGAKGMWQFMLRSAKLYGLEINSYVDERLDPFKSADAAARYLEDSYKMFGDWSLAISSYNCGAGNVNKAIRRCGGKRDFWSVYDYLPRETRGYMPAFVGAMYAINYSKELGLVPDSSPLPAQVDTFLIRKNLHFGQIHELVGIPIEVLESMNPQYIRDIIPGNSKEYILRIPYSYSGEFIAHEDSLYTYKKDFYFDPQTLTPSKTTRSTPAASGNGGGTIVYKVKSGDSLGKIAKKYHVTVKQLKQWNKLRSDVVRIGQRITIYTGGSAPAESASTAKPAAQQAQGTAPASGGSTSYTVKKGDTLSSIAREYGVSVQAIMKENNLNGSNIQVGKTLRIPAR